MLGRYALSLHDDLKMYFLSLSFQIKEIAKVHNIGSFKRHNTATESAESGNTDTRSISEARKNFNRVHRERKTAILFGLLLVFFAFTWGPIFLMDTLLYFGVYIDQGVINFGVALSHFNSAFNPVIYCFKREFRNTYKRWYGRNRRVGALFSETNETDYAN